MGDKSLSAEPNAGENTPDVGALLLQPEVAAGLTMKNYGMQKSAGLDSVLRSLIESTTNLQTPGQVHQAERMALAQAATLESLFHRQFFARRLAAFAHFRHRLH